MKDDLSDRTIASARSRQRSSTTTAITVHRLFSRHRFAAESHSMMLRERAWLISALKHAGPFGTSRPALSSIQPRASSPLVPYVRHSGLNRPLNASMTALCVRLRRRSIHIEDGRTGFEEVARGGEPSRRVLAFERLIASGPWCDVARKAR
jgi:hypothetical protein